MKQKELFAQGLVAKEVLATSYNEETANVDLITDFMYFVRRTYGMIFAKDMFVKGSYLGFNWAWEYFLGTKRTPIRMPRAYVEGNKLISQKIFTERKIMDLMTAYPGISRRTSKKLKEGILVKIGESNCDKQFVSLNPGDREGLHTNGIELVKVNEDLRQAYLAFIAKGKREGSWDQVHQMVEEFYRRYPEQTLFKEGMNAEEQFLAHLDSAGAFFNRACEMYDVRGLVNLKETYVCSLDFKEQIKGVYGKRVAHYFDDILKNRTNAINRKMCYSFNTKKVK